MTGTQGEEQPAGKAPSRRGPAWLLDNPPPGVRPSQIVDLDAFDVAVLDPEDPADGPEALRNELLGPSDDDGLLPLAPLPKPGGYDYTVLGPAADATRAAADAIRALHRRSASAWLGIGMHLLVVKAALKHGQFTEWLRADFAWSPRTARAMMRGAIQLQMLKTAEFAELDPPVVVALARAPRAVLDHVRKEPADARRALTVEDVTGLCAAHQPRSKPKKFGKGKDWGTPGHVDQLGAEAFVTRAELDAHIANEKLGYSPSLTCAAAQDLRFQLEAIWRDEFALALAYTKGALIDLKRVLAADPAAKRTREHLRHLVETATCVQKCLDGLCGVGVVSGKTALSGLWADARAAMALLAELNPRKSTVDEYLAVLRQADALLARFVAE